MKTIKFKRIRFLMGCLLSWGTFLAIAENTPPNILIIFVDDLGYEAVGAHGGLSYATPEIDTMASEGLTFTRAYTSPVCTPSRVSLHTGLYTSDHGWTDVLNVHLGTSDKVDFTSLHTFAQLARDAGYATSVTGKWQLATYLYHPNHLIEAGFDSWCFWQIWDGEAKTERYWNPSLNRDGNVLEDLEDAFGPDVLKEYVIEKMTEARDEEKPFLIVHNEMLPHTPIVSTPDDIAAGRPMSLENMIAYMDKLTGELLEEIESLGIRENTYVFFIGDNGTDTHATRQTIEGTVTDGKRDLTDGGTHVPFIVWGPASIPQGERAHDLVDITDMFPTICALAGIPIPEDIPYRGRSIVPQMAGRRGAPRAWVHQGIGNKQSIFDGKWRLRSDGLLHDARALPIETQVTSTSADSLQATNRLQYLFNSLSLAQGGSSPDIIIDNDASSGVTFTGTWQVSTYSSENYGIDYSHDQNSGQGNKSVQYALNVPTTDTYEIFMRWPSASNRATNTPVSITSDNGTYQTTINQQANGGKWVSLGEFVIHAGTGSVSISNEAANGYVVADAVGYSAAGSLPEEAYTTWARSQFGPASVDDPEQEASVWGHSANPDGDPYSNLVEYGLGLDPINPQDTSAIEIRSLNGTPTFYTVIRSGATDLTLSPQVTSDLNSDLWTPLVNELIETQRRVLNKDFVEVELTPPLQNIPPKNLFLRYEVTK
ncbi:sulfatase-like hydrolase/transferase [Kiritimatiellota bacterium B12222]|nr:sulfatase-like hydrolase/transferase [Kiritimatiellota bacterium B12222]